MQVSSHVAESLEKETYLNDGPKKNQKNATPKKRFSEK